MSTSEKAAEVLRTLLEKMAVEHEVVASEDEERVTLEVKGPETGLVIGKKGQTLDALQYLVNKIVSRGLGEDEGKPINVDAEGYRARRAESLIELAQRLAEKARRTGKPVAADPMSPADRRIIHVALANTPGLTTRSEGEGIYRHLVIFPTSEAQSGGEPVESSTIAAIATGLGGGIGVVRLSGPHAEPILTALVRPWPKRAPTHKLHLTHAYHPLTGERIDQVLAVVMRAPSSYTGEDVAEIHGHGGRLVMERILAAALAAGAKMAQPGEYTRRAFEAGRIDLTRAEAVAQLIGARSQRALQAAQSLHEGALEKAIRGVRGRLVARMAELEGAIDFPEDAHDAPPEASTAQALAELRAEVERLAASYRKVVHEGAEVVLLGRVNAGKSSLLNALAGEERALVDAQAGTTRDSVEATVDVGGLSLKLVDTAGERFADGAGELEQRGLELARKRRGRADAFVLVVDGTVGLLDGERALMGELSPLVVAWNKRDVSGPAPAAVAIECVETSARTGEGLDDSKRAILGALGASDEESGALVVSLRQKEALDAAAAALARAAAILGGGEPSELAAVEGRAALNELGRVTGETVDAEVLDAIFARFCIGK